MVKVELRTHSNPVSAKLTPISVTAVPDTMGGNRDLWTFEGMKEAAMATREARAVVPSSLPYAVLKSSP